MCRDYDPPLVIPKEELIDEGESYPVPAKEYFDRKRDKEKKEERPEIE